MTATTRTAPTSVGPWSTEGGCTMWLLGEHTEAMRWAVRREAGDYGWDYWDRPISARRVWLVEHICEEPDECWCAAFEGSDCIDEVPKGTPGAVSAWRIGG